jgi:hypothetical protein
LFFEIEEMPGLANMKAEVNEDRPGIMEPEGKDDVIPGLRRL